MKKSSVFKYLTNYKTNSIVFKQFLIILLAVILPMTAFFTVLSANVTRQSQNKISEVYNQRLSNIASALDNVLSEMKLFTYSIAGNENIVNFINRNNSADLYLNSDFSKIMGSSYMTYKYLDSVYLYSNVNRYVISSVYNGTIDSFSDRSWLSQYSYLSRNELAITPRKINNDYPYCLSFILPVFNNIGEKSGAVIVNVNVETLLKTVAGDDNSDFEIYVLDNYKKLMLSNDIERMYSEYNQYAYVYERIKYAKEHSSDMFLYTLSSPQSGLEYNGIASLNRTGSESHRVLLIILMIIFMIIISLFVSVFLAMRTFRPVQSILDVISGDADAEDKIGINNELSFIIRNINQTIQDKRLAEVQLEERVQLMNNAYSAALQAQINPHFLYNTLETINFMAMEKFHGENDISAITACLSKMLRISLNSEEKIVPLSTELEHVRLYIRILTLRYPDKCRFNFDIPAELSDCRVAKLMLQPLVENAFMHGIRPKNDGNGQITISAQRIDNELAVHVTDNGCGMDKKLLRSIREILSSDIYLSSKHIGINNVNRRIKMYFGPDYGVSVDSVYGTGSEFTVTLPLDPDQTDNN